MAKLTAARRNRMSASTFLGPGRSYPAPDKRHAALAVARSRGKAIGPSIKAKACRRFPSLPLCKKS